MRPPASSTSTLRACVGVLLVLMAAGAACKKTSTGSSGSDNPTPTAPTPAPTPAPSQAPVLELPIAAADSANAAYGLWPFGVHGGGHASDGHPGWDVEFRPGATLRAPADGTVQSVTADPNAPSLFTLQIMHGTRYRTDYTNLASVAPGVTPGAAVRTGQVLGTPASITAFIGTRQVTYAMTHFQFDDFEQNIGQTNPFAANPETVLSGGARAVLDTIWRSAAYSAELCEPFLGNTRDVSFPLTRSWTRESGALAARVDFTRTDANAGSTYQYALIDAAGATTESGTAQVDANAQPLATIDLQPSAGAARRGVWDVVDDTMQLDYGAPGAARPGSLAGAGVYRTVR
jgi:hypothetical protein